MSTYTVTERGGCRIITGELPLSAIGVLTHGMSRKAVMDVNLARMLGATFVVGEPADIDRLKEDPSVVAQARDRVSTTHQHLSDAARAWLATGERGISSDAMFARLSGSVPRTTATPSDTADLRRCRLLLEQVPEFGTKFPMMADISPTWAALVQRWDELCTLMDAETPDWRKGGGVAVKTYYLMKAIGC